MPSEFAPLLGRRKYYHHVFSRLRDSEAYPAAFCVVLMLLGALYDFTIITPTVTLYESAVCRTYYLENPVQGDGPGARPCKLPAVQEQLALLRGWKAFFDALPTFFVAVPLCSLAARTGPKLVLALANLGMILHTLWILCVCLNPADVDVRFVWLGSIFYFCGGGLIMQMSMIFLVATRVIKEKSRGRVFYLLYSPYLGAQLLGPYLSLETGGSTPVLPLMIAIGCQCLSLILLAFIPPEHQPDSSLEDPKGNLDPEHADPRPTQAEVTSPHLGRNLLAGWQFLKQRNVLLAALPAVIGTFRPATLYVLIQYASLHFEWSLNNAGILISEGAAINLVLFLVVVPQLMTYATVKRGVSPQVVDLYILRSSFSVLAIGALLLGLAPTLAFIVSSNAIFALGFGCRIALLSFLTSSVPFNDIAKLYSVIQIAENVGVLVGDPVLQHLFALGLRNDTLSDSLPFYVASGLFLVSTLATLLMRAS